MKTTPLQTGQLTAWQLGLLLVTGAVITNATIGDSLLVRRLGQELWVAWVLGLPLGALALWSLARLGARYPGRNLVEILLRLCGAAGYVLTGAFLAMFLAAMALSLREAAYLTLPMMPNTPPYVMITPWVLLAMYSSYVGIEVLARVNAFLLLAVDIPLGLLLSVALLPQHNLAYLSPVFVHRWSTLLATARFSAGSWGAMAALLMFTNIVADVRRMPRVALWVVLLVVVMGVGHDLGAVLTFGPAAGGFLWPSFEEVRVLEFGRFVERLDVLAIVLWVHGFWIEIAVLFQAVAVGLARLCGLRSYRSLIVPLGVLLLVLAFFPAPHADVDRWRRVVLNGWVMLVLGVLLPPLLLGWSHLREGRRARDRAGAPGGVVHGAGRVAGDGRLPLP